MSHQTKFGSKPNVLSKGERPLRKPIKAHDPSWPFPPLSGPIPPKRKRKTEKLSDVDEALF